MKKGGYKIIDFKGTALSGTAVELSGIYDQIVDDYDKPIMVSGVSISGELQDDAYASVQEKTAQDLSKSVELTVYGGIIIVTDDDEVSFIVSKTTAELIAEIGDLDDLETTEKGSTVGAINEIVVNQNDVTTLFGSSEIVVDNEYTLNDNISDYKKVVITYQHNNVGNCYMETLYPQLRTPVTVTLQSIYASDNIHTASLVFTGNKFRCNNSTSNTTVYISGIYGFKVY